ncbi:MAG: hypothetical protein ACEPOZ_07610 [Marinifilaceae bacterium]
MNISKLLIGMLMVSFMIARPAKASIKSKEIKKSFPVENATSLKIANQYGKLQVKSWDKNTIEFAIKISVESNKADKAQTMLDNISVEFTQGQNYVNAETKFGDFFGFHKLTNSLFSKGKMKIDYLVRIPASLPLEIVQKNGKIFMDSHSAPLTLELNNGEFTAQNLKGEGKMKFRGSTIQIEELNTSEMDLGNCELRITDAEKITAESRDSKINIKSIGTFNLHSNRDKVELDQVEYLYGSSGISKFEINDLGSELDYDLKLGHMNIFNVHNMFSFIKLDSKFSDLGLSFMQNSNFNVEIKHKSVKLDYPANFKLKQKDTSEKNTYITSGLVGKDKSPSDVKIRANNCKINLN